MSSGATPEGPGAVTGAPDLPATSKASYSRTELTGSPSRLPSSWSRPSPRSSTRTGRPGRVSRLSAPAVQRSAKMSRPRSDLDLTIFGSTRWKVLAWVILLLAVVCSIPWWS